MNNKSKRRIKKRNSPILLFSVLLIVSLLIVLLLEFINYSKGKDSFIFTEILKKERKADNPQRFSIEFLDFLNSNDIHFDYFRDTGGRYHFKLDIFKEQTGKILKKFKYFIKKYKFIISPIEIKRGKEKTLYFYKTIFMGKTTHFLLINSFNKPKTTETIPTVKRWDPLHPKIAFIIDDIGAYNIGAYEIKKLGIPITASVLPDSPYAREEGEWLSKYKLNTLIHLPMQPKKDQNNHLNTDKVITTESTISDIEKLINHAMEIVPLAGGINNHQGSLITADKKMISKVLSVIKEKNMYFIDSKTDFDSIAFKTAKSMNIKTAVRDVFLDHNRSYEHSVFQIKRLVKIAKKTGKGIAIGHPFESTLAAIADSLEYIRDEGVTIVFVTELLE